MIKNKKIVWQPDALPNEPARYGKQYDFLHSPEDIVGMYGGKGSGKSDLLIMDCIRPEKLKNPRWHGVIFRREYKRLTEIIDRAHYWFNQLPQLKAHWQGSPNFRFVFPSGAWLAFHNVERLGDEKKYQGWQICDLKFDQLEEFLEPMVNFLLLQNRSGDLNLHSTMKFTANPLGVGHTWLTKRYIKKYERNLSHTLISEVDGKQYVKTFKWIHSTVFDNPLLARDEGYIATLASEPNEMIRRAMFSGDPNVMYGQFFDMFDDKKQHVKPYGIPKEWKLICSIDPGWGGICSAGLMAQDFTGAFHRIGTYYESRRNNTQNAEGIKSFWETNKFTNGRKPSLFVVGRDAFAHKDRQAIISSEATFADIFQDYGMTLTPAVTDRTNGWGTLKGLMPGRLFIFKDLNNPLVEEMISVPTDQNDINDIQGKGNDSSVADHAIDELRYGVMSSFKPVERPKPKQGFVETVMNKKSNDPWKVGDL